MYIGIFLLQSAPGGPYLFDNPLSRTLISVHDTICQSAPSGTFLLENCPNNTAFARALAECFSINLAAWTASRISWLLVRRCAVRIMRRGTRRSVAQTEALFRFSLDASVTCIRYQSATPTCHRTAHEFWRPVHTLRISTISFRQAHASSRPCKRTTTIMGYSLWCVAHRAARLCRHTHTSQRVACHQRVDEMEG